MPPRLLRPVSVLCSTVFDVLLDRFRVLKFTLLFRERAQIGREHPKNEGLNVVRGSRRQEIPTKMVPEFSAPLAASSIINPAVYVAFANINACL